MFCVRCAVCVRARGFIESRIASGTATLCYLRDYLFKTVFITTLNDFLSLIRQFFPSSFTASPRPYICCCCFLHSCSRDMLDLSSITK